MAVEINGKVYRNLPEQVKKNQEDIEELQEGFEALNIQNGSVAGSLQQLTDNNFTFNNSNSTRDGESVTTEAAGQYSVELGGKSRAEGKRAVSQGTQTIAEGNYSHAEGNNNISVGTNSHAEGLQTVATGGQSHSEGYQTQAVGSNSHAEGAGTYAGGDSAHAEGKNTRAFGASSYAGGDGTIVFGYNSFGFGAGLILGDTNDPVGTANKAAVGLFNENKPSTVFEVGNGTADDARSNAFEVYADGTIGIPNFNSNGTRIGTKRIKCVNGVLRVID